MNAVQKPGFHTVSFDAGDMSSGAYFLAISGGSPFENRGNDSHKTVKEYSGIAS